MMKYLCHTKYILLFFFFNDTATTEIYTLSLHDALPIWAKFEPLYLELLRSGSTKDVVELLAPFSLDARRDRKSTRLNSSHSQISYAVFCLKKKKKWIPLLTDLVMKTAHRSRYPITSAAV